MVRFIFTLQLEYEIELLDKLNICFKQGEFVQYKEVKEFKKLINTKEELESDWELPTGDTWYNRMFLNNYSF